MIQFVFLFFLTLLTALLVDVPTSLLVVCAFFAGKGLSYLCGGVDDNSKTSNIYGILFLAGWCYMLMCYRYMVGHNYEWLLAYDSYNAFIPGVEDYINMGKGNLWRVLKIIFEDYDFFSRQEYFYWSYSCFWGIVINLIGGSLYFGLQTSTLFIYGFVGVVLYKLCISYGFDKEKAYKHVLIALLLSIVFFYSSQVLRDIHVLLCYLIVFYLASKSRFSVFVLMEMLFVIFITCGLRIESGLFLLLCIPAYLLLSVQNKKYRFYSIIGSVTFTFLFIILMLNVFQSLYGVFNANVEAYTEGVEEGRGMLGMFQRIPFIGDIISIIYNASQPIPFWIRLDPSKNLQFGGNASNIMNFPRIPAAFLNVMTYVYVFSWLFIGRIRKKVAPMITKAHSYQLWIGLLFLYLQSAVISQRRLMGYYCIFYLFMFLIYDNVSSMDRKNLNIITVSVFVVLQIIGFIYLY